MRYQERLNDRRKVYLNGKLIANVSTEEEFSEILKYIQYYYDCQDTNPLHTVKDERGNTYSTTLLTPRNVEDLQLKRQVYKDIADNAYGMLGRTPDFVHAALSSLNIHCEFLGSSNQASYSDNAKNYYEYVKAHHLFVSHGAINPQIDRSKSLGAQENKYAGVYSTEHDSKGIWVNGAKMVVTLAPVADELLIFNMPGLTEEDSDFALAFAIPVNTEGIKIICRKSMRRNDYSHFDFPLSNRIDEIDAHVIFENVFVPWERVLVYKDVHISNSFFDKSYMRHHSGHQDIVRGSSKIEFLVSVYLSVAEMLNLNKFVNIQEKLGRALTFIEQTKASVVYSEATATYSEKGVLTPSIDPIMSIRYNLPNMYAQVVEDILKLSGGSMLSTPVYNDFQNENKDILNKAFATGRYTAEQRVQLLNLAWDVSGDSGGQRQMNYEYFHGGDPMRIAANYYNNYNKESLYKKVESLLEK